MRRILALSALALGLVLAASTSFAADEAMGSVKGSVVGADSKPVAGATVQLFTVAPKAAPAAAINHLARGDKGGKGGAAPAVAAKETTTDADGKYEIKDVPVGQYMVAAKTADAAGKAKGAITVTAGQATEVPAITLAPKPVKKGKKG